MISGAVSTVTAIVTMLCLITQPWWRLNFLFIDKSRDPAGLAAAQEAARGPGAANRLRGVRGRFTEIVAAAAAAATTTYGREPGG